MNTTFQNFFPKDDIMIESGCEPYNNCNTDGLTFKSFTLRWLAVTTQLVPQTASIIWPFIQASAQGAAGQCDGGDDGMTCGYHWTTTTWDGTQGVGQQMSALAVIQANLMITDNLPPPLTLDTGATSKSDPNAGSTPETMGDTWATRKITTAARAAAGLLTAMVLGSIFSGTYWLVAIGND